MAAYAVQADLLLGNIPVPTDFQKYLDAGADEIDSQIGFKYATPVVPDNSVEQRPAGLLLKKINAWLATGRIVLARDAGGEDDQLHQYGQYMVQEALKALNDIVTGAVILPGVDLATPDNSTVTGPQISNGEDASLVDEFNTVFGNPAMDVLNRYNVVSGNPYTW